MTDFNIGLKFENTFLDTLEGLYVPWRGTEALSPKTAKINDQLASELGLDPEVLDTSEGAAILSGGETAEGSEPIAMAYAGHQFGGFSPQLGDGRALLLGEVIDKRGDRRDLHLKGSGRTPFSRNGDGKAALGPVLREYLIGEAMHALGVPTTRALAIILTGENVYREKVLPGAVLVRVASSHLRVGTFQYLAVRGDLEKLSRLADYSIARHYPHVFDLPDRYLKLFAAVCDRQAQLISKWMLVGFVHGVMNTDNMTISGETIDYGPCAFIDQYDPNAVFSSIDDFGRYAYSRQPNIGQWNLARFAESLLPLIDSDDMENAKDLATNELNKFPEIFRNYWLAGMRKKLGLTTEHDDDLSLANDLFREIENQDVDFTLLFRRLAETLAGDDEALRRLFGDHSPITTWIERWRARLELEKCDPQEVKRTMDAANPLYIPRNHLVEEALAAAVENGDMAIFNRFLDVLSDPYSKREGFEKYESGAPSDFGPYQTFCGT